MASKTVSVWYDDDGEVSGFLSHEPSTLKQRSPVEFELAREDSAT